MQHLFLGRASARPYELSFIHKHRVTPYLNSGVDNMWGEHAAGTHRPPKGTIPSFVESDKLPARRRYTAKGGKGQTLTRTVELRPHTVSQMVTNFIPQGDEFMTAG